MSTDESTPNQIARQFGAQWQQEPARSLAFMGLQAIANFSHRASCELTSCPVYECPCNIDDPPDHIAAVTLAAMARTRA